MRRRIAGAAKAAGRDPASITLVAVSKTHGADRVRELLAAGQRVFGDPAALAALNRLVHPHLLIALREQIISARKVMNNVVVDAALIFEWGIQREFDHVVLVVAPESDRLARLMTRDGLSRDEAEARIRSQMPEEEKRKLAGLVIENDGDGEALRVKVDEVWEKLGK